MTSAMRGMLPGIERLRRAGELLERDGDGSPVVLLKAASEVWGAMFELHGWPTEVQAEAVELQACLFRYGPIRMTIGQMVEPERLELRRELLKFCEFAGRFDGGNGLESQTPHS